MAAAFGFINPHLNPKIGASGSKGGPFLELPVSGWCQPGEFFEDSIKGGFGIEASLKPNRKDGVLLVRFFGKQPLGFLYPAIM